MKEQIKRYSLILLRLVLAAAFLAAGIAKLSGAEMMVATYETIGIGQWFRYLTGIIEIGSSVLLFVPGKQSWGALLLVGTMIGAILAHLFILGPSAVPALVLGVLSAIVLYAYRIQLPLQIPGNSGQATRISQ